MANKTEKFSRTIEYKGSLDISQILSSIDTIQKQLKNTHTKTFKDDSFNEVNKTITKLKELNRTMQEMRDKGFSNPKEFQEFLKMSEKSKALISQIKSQLGSVKVDALAADVNNITKAIEKQNTVINKLKNDEKSIINDTIKDKQARNDITKALQDNEEQLKDEKQTETIINKILTEQLEKRKKIADETNKAYENEKASYEQNRAAAMDLEKFKFTDQQGKLKTIGNTFLSKTFLKDTTGNGIDKQQLSEGLKSALLSEDATKGFRNYLDFLKKIGIELKGTQINQENFNNLFNAMSQNLANNTALEEQKKKLEELSEKYKKTGASIKQLTEMSTNGDAQNLAMTIINLNSAIATKNQLSQQEAAAADLSRNSNAQVESTLRGLTIEEERYNNSLREGITATNNSVSAQNKMDSGFEQLANRFKYMLSFMSAWHAALRALKQTFSDIQNIDKAFASIAMVTDKTIADLWNQYDEYAKIANDLGQSTESVIKSSALYYQQGLNTDQALALTKDTMKLATLASIVSVILFI